MGELLSTCPVSLGKFLNVSETPGKDNNNSNNNRHGAGWLCARRCPEQFTHVDSFTLCRSPTVYTVITFFSHTRKLGHREVK